MIENPLVAMFGAVGIVYGLIVPLAFVLLFAVFAIASSASPGAKPRVVAQAAYCALMMGVGLLLMTIATLPTVASVISGMSYSGSTYIGLLALFLGGGGMYLFHDRWMQSLDSTSKLIPSLLFLFTVKSIGMLAALLSGLSIVLTLILGEPETEWWVMPVTVFLYGILLLWCTRAERSPKPLFQCKTVAKPRVAPVAVKKAAPKRKAAVRKKKRK